MNTALRIAAALALLAVLQSTAELSVLVRALNQFTAPDVHFARGFDGDAGGAAVEFEDRDSNFFVDDDSLARAAAEDKVWQGGSLPEGSERGIFARSTLEGHIP